jgi:signal transduction protein with GAF and PtsI domain
MPEGGDAAVTIVAAAAGVAIGWAASWFVRSWRASTVLIAEIRNGADDVNAEWERLWDAIEEGP